MVMKEGAPRAGSSSIKTPRPSGSGIKTNGGIAAPAPVSSHRMNGSKPHR